MKGAHRSLHHRQQPKRQGIDRIDEIRPECWSGKSLVYSWELRGFDEAEDQTARLSECEVEVIGFAPMGLRIGGSGLVENRAPMASTAGSVADVERLAEYKQDCLYPSYFAIAIGYGRTAAPNSHPPAAASSFEGRLRDDSNGLQAPMSQVMALALHRSWTH